MAVRTMSNGVWSSWSVMKIKGEKGIDGINGKDGKDGTSVNIKGALDSTDQLPKEGNSVGDTYIINGELWVWDGDSWENCGQLKGEPGESNYIHVAYSNDNGQTLTDNNGTDPGKYIGICVSTDNRRPTDPKQYTWSLFRGEDGFGYEYIYKRTTTFEAPDVPAGVNQDEHVPAG